MTRRRFYAPPAAFALDGARVTLAAEETAHLRQVLRLRAGDEAFVFDGTGREFRCVVEDDDMGRRGDSRRHGARATLVVLEEVAPPSAESPLRLTLAVALLKGEKFDLVVQKATELGVWCVVPIETRRADVRLRNAPDAERRVARWQRLALEAAKQSGRALVPEVSAPVSFAALLAGTAHEIDVLHLESASPMHQLMFTERGGQRLYDVLNVLDERDARPSRITALVGPEGGWEDEEIMQGTSAGWHMVTLGGRTLRAETAAIVVVSLLQHACGDLR